MAQVKYRYTYAGFGIIVLLIVIIFFIVNYIKKKKESEPKNERNG